MNKEDDASSEEDPSDPSMKSTSRFFTKVTVMGITLAIALFVSAAMPAQAAYVVQKAASTARAAVMHLCERFCGNHHHHHGHRWCGHGEDYWCPGH
ncbi:MAG: hypothetical protein JNN17_18050 [Verrucomicrobiaceae bacterium]|nr:hypothetical protein [Verrucomicrobiaceae bacterium]